MTMGPLRDLWSDLVEKRLWPVALALVAALVAVPLLLAKSPSGGGQPAASASAPAPAVAPGSSAGEPIVSVADGTPGGAPLRGHAKDPFRQQFLQPKAASGGPATTAPSGGATAPGASGGSGRSGGSGSTPKPRKTFLIAHVDVRFGRAAGTLRSITDVPRLTPLPSATSPVVIFLGMRSDRKTAVFLISSDVHAQGDGKCTPSVKQCEAVELTEGQTEILDVTGADGSVTEYELDLVNVTVEQTTSQSKAHAAHERQAAQARASADRWGALQDLAGADPAAAPAASP